MCSNMQESLRESDWVHALKEDNLPDSEEALWCVALPSSALHIGWSQAPLYKPHISGPNNL
jgi:hypothetical protein